MRFILFIFIHFIFSLPLWAVSPGEALEMATRYGLDLAIPVIGEWAKNEGIELSADNFNNALTVGAQFDQEKALIALGKLAKERKISFGADAVDTAFRVAIDHGNLRAFYFTISLAAARDGRWNTVGQPIVRVATLGISALRYFNYEEAGRYVAMATALLKRNSQLPKDLELRSLVIQFIQESGDKVCRDVLKDALSPPAPPAPVPLRLPLVRYSH